MLHGYLGERDAAFGELRAAADAARDAQRLLEDQPQARAAETELERAFLGVADLSHDLGLADARRVEPRRRQEQVLGGAFALPRAQTPLGFAVRGRAPRQQLERIAAQVLDGRAVAAREDQLDAVAGREIGELLELHALRKVLQLSRGVLLLQRELGERFAAALAPRHADETEVFEQSRYLLPRVGTAYRRGAARCHGRVTVPPTLECELRSVCYAGRVLA